MTDEFLYPAVEAYQQELSLSSRPESLNTLKSEDTPLALRMLEKLEDTPLAVRSTFAWSGT